MINRLRRYASENGIKKTIFKGLLFSLNIFFITRHIMYILARRNNTVNITRKVNGFKMVLDLKNDIGISKELFIFAKRETVSVDYLLHSNIVHKGDTVLDVGANIGYYALLESRLTGENGSVYALEPVNKNLNLLEKSVTINNIQNISIFKLAVGANSCLTSVNISTRGNWSSINQIDGVVYNAKEDVFMTTVDDFVKDKKIPDFIRMDIEGYEYFAFKGMVNTLAYHPYLMVEIHPNLLSTAQLIEIFNILKENQYSKVHVIFDPGYIWLDSKSKLRPLFEWLVKKTGEYFNFTNHIQIMSLDDFLKLTTNEKICIHAIFE